MDANLRDKQIIEVAAKTMLFFQTKIEELLGHAPKSEEDEALVEAILLLVVALCEGSIGRNIQIFGMVCTSSVGTNMQKAVLEAANLPGQSSTVN